MPDCPVGQRVGGSEGGVGLGLFLLNKVDWMDLITREIFTQRLRKGEREGRYDTWGVSVPSKGERG